METNKVISKTTTKLCQMCPQYADKVVRVENTASRKSASVRPALGMALSCGFKLSQLTFIPVQHPPSTQIYICL